MAIISPFEQIHEQLGASFSEHDGWRLPDNFGDPAAENTALREASAGFDLSSFGKITIKGPSSQAVIDGLLATGADCPDGKWVWAATANPEMGSSLRLGREGDTFTLFTLPKKREQMLALAGEIANQLPASDVTITDITETTAMLAIYGPGAVEAVTSIMPFDISQVGENGIMTLSFFMMKVIIVRGGWHGGDGIELLCPKSAATMAAGAVAKYHKKFSITLAGMECLTEALAERQITL